MKFLLKLGWNKLSVDYLTISSVFLLIGEEILFYLMLVHEKYKKDRNKSPPNLENSLIFLFKHNLIHQVRGITVKYLSSCYQSRFSFRFTAVKEFILSFYLSYINIGRCKPMFIYLILSSMILCSIISCTFTWVW